MTKIISFGFSEPKSLRLSSRMISKMASCDPLYNPICWIQRFINKVWETAKANKEFRLSIFYIKMMSTILYYRSFESLPSTSRIIILVGISTLYQMPLVVWPTLFLRFNVSNSVLNIAFNKVLFPEL